MLRSGSQPPKKQARQELRSELVAVSTGPKSCIARVLQTLQQKGLLIDDQLGGKDELKQLTIASQVHAEAHTPYGPVVQDMGLEMNDGKIFKWDFIHPFAFLWYLSLKCVEFGEMMTAALGSTVHGVLSLLLYGDELVPGNVLRHDAGRKVFAFYYAFLEWPTWILHQSDAWFCFGALRTNILEDVKGGVSSVFAKIVRIMFVTGPANYTTGVFYVSRGADILYRATLRGIIADEKGLKEAFDLKGASGTKPCPSCQNMFNFIHKGRGSANAYRLPLDNTSRKDWIPHTDESIHEAHNRLSNMVEEGLERRKGKFEQLETDFGVNYNPDGLIGHPALKTVIKPVSHYIRDWQHTYCSNGVASAHLAGALHAITEDPTLIREGIGLDTITEYCSHFNVPASHGRVNKYWFDPDYLADDHVKHFASDVLHMIPCLLAFMVDLVQPYGVLLRHIAALDALNKVMSCLLHIGRVTDEKLDELQGLVDRHLQLFAELYRNFTKVKFHHAGHIPKDLWKLGVGLSCLPLERKHKLLKSLIVYIFRNVEMTCIKDYVNHVVQQFIEHRFQFKEYWLQDPKRVSFQGQCFDSSFHACIETMWFLFLKKAM